MKKMDLMETGVTTATSGSTSGTERRGGRNTLRTRTRVGRTNDNPNPERSFLDDAIDIFVTKRPGALGEAAFRYDNKDLYEKATSVGAYYLREGDSRLIASQADSCANRINGVETAIVLGPGPGDIFQAKEWEVLKRLPRLKRVVTIDIVDDYNRQAGAVLKEQGEKIGRKFEHFSIVRDFREAATHFDQFALDHGIPLNEKRAVICTGSTIMNLPVSVTDHFPREEMETSLGGMCRMAGPEGHVLVTYDSNDNRDSLLAAYSSPEAQDLFFNVVDTLAEKCEPFKGLTREHFEYIVEWDPEAFTVSQRLRVAKPFTAELPYENEFGQMGFHIVTLIPGEEFHIISSYKPTYELVTDAGTANNMRTSLVTKDASGPTLQLMTSKPKLAMA